LENGHKIENSPTNRPRNEMTPKDFHEMLHKFGVIHSRLPYYLNPEQEDDCEEVEQKQKREFFFDLRKM